MKKGFFLLLLVGLLALPGLALGLSWAEYVAEIEGTLAGQSGEVVLAIPEGVAPYLWDADSGESADVPLVVPQGISLVLEGGEIPGMVLGGGELTLRGVRVTGLADAPSLYIAQPHRERMPLQLSLTLEEDCVLESPGAFASQSVLSCYPEPWTPWRLIIENRGTLQAGPEAAAIDLAFTGKQPVSLSLSNTGSISGVSGVRLNFHPKANYWCLLQNDGEISGTETGLFLHLSGRMYTDYLSIQNGAEGIIRCGEMGSAALTLVADSKQGATQLINSGTLSGQTAALSMFFTRDKLLPFEIVNRGSLSCADEAAAPITLAIAQKVKRPREILDETGIRRELAETLEKSGFYALPKGTRMRAYINATVLQEPVPEASEAFFESMQMVLPALSWRDYVRQMELALAQAIGDFPYYPTRRILAHGQNDKELVVPEGVRLRLMGGVFETLRLGGGHLRLSGTRVEVMEDDHTAILIAGRDDPVRQVLVLDEDTTIANYGLNGVAMRTADSFFKSVSLDITNYGNIECLMGQGVALHLKTDSRNTAAVRFQNQGQIYGETLGLSLGADTFQGTGEVRFDNVGQVSSNTGTGAALSLRSQDAQVLLYLDNTAAGSIRSAEGAALSMNLRESTGTLAGYGSEAWISNDGVLEGAPVVLSLATPAQHPVPMYLRGAGAWTSASGAPEVSLQFDQSLERKTDTAMSEAAFESVREDYLRLIGVSNLPREARVTSRLLVWDRGTLLDPLYVQDTR